jgi:hypothetical protein
MFFKLTVAADYITHLQLLGKDDMAYSIISSMRQGDISDDLEDPVLMENDLDDLADTDDDDLKCHESITVSDIIPDRLIGHSRVRSHEAQWARVCDLTDTFNWVAFDDNEVSETDVLTD